METDEGLFPGFAPPAVISPGQEASAEENDARPRGWANAEQSEIMNVLNAELQLSFSTQHSGVQHSAFENNSAELSSVKSNPRTCQL